VIVAAAFVPSTPLLVPAVASGAAPELDVVRRAALEATRSALACAPERVVVLGAGGRDATHATATGTFRGFGVDLEVPLDPAAPAAPGAPALPLSLSIGAWLLAQVGWPGERAALELDPQGDPTTPGKALAAEDRRTALLVVADGSAARTEKAPASLHPDAAAFDAAVADALRTGDPARLAALDRDHAAEVSSSGWPAWAAAAAALGPGSYDAALLADEAPLGVGYLVATWLRR
jgi:hypothetical protein